jgi:hypothetical protein
VIEIAEIAAIRLRIGIASAPPPRSAAMINRHDQSP